MRKLMIIGVLLLGACAQRQDDGYSAAKTWYAHCLRTSPDCERERQEYVLAATDRQIRQTERSIQAQTQANTSAWAQWYLGTQRTTTCSRLGSTITCR